MQSQGTRKEDRWLLENAADSHVCNQKHLFSTYYDDPTPISGATASTLSPGKGTICLNLALEDGSPGSTLTLTNVWYLPQCPANLVSQARLNDSNAFYDNEDWTLYLRDSSLKRVTLGYIPRVNNSFILKTIQDQDVAVHLVSHDAIDVDSEPYYQWPQHAVYKTSGPIKLSTWHARLGHMNFIWTTQYLKKLDIPYTNDAIKDSFFCHTCEMSKATKRYNREPQKHATEPFQEVHTNMIGQIKPTGFLGERYFFTFTDSYTRFTHVYTAVHKHEWFSHLQTYYSLAQNKSQKSKPIAKIRTDYGAELRSGISDKWMLKEGITFEPSCPHSQEQNGVSERMGRTIMDMVRSTIIGGSIPDDLWPEIVLAMVHVKNIRPTSSLTDGRTPHELMEKELPTIDHLRVLGSTVYVFIHEADRKGEKSKAAKFAPRAQRGKLVGYDGKTIYRVFLEKSNSIIRVKDLSIHEDATAKEATDLAYDAVQIMENTASLQQEDQSATSNHDETTTRPSETSPELTTKRKRGRPRKEPAKVALITMLTDILSEPQWQPTNDIFHCVDSSSSNDPYVLMAKFLKEVGAYSPETFAFVTQLDVLDPPTYKAAMSSKLAEK